MRGTYNIMDDKHDLLMNKQIMAGTECVTVATVIPTGTSLLNGAMALY